MAWNDTNEPPWKATEINGFWEVTTDRGDPGEEYDVTSSGDEEVARLQAAAPALLNALTRYRVQHDQGMHPSYRPCVCDSCQEAEKAIKAAKGV
jgi:type VI protein secretion system component VasF